MYWTKDDSGNDVEKYIDQNLKENADVVKNSVEKKGWDYISIVSGIPGVGKSTFTQAYCKYLDPTFTTKDRICFTVFGEKGLLERTTNAKPGQAFMLDESFADMNTQVTRSPEFIAIINHLQLIRQKGLYILLCLPNFFDLGKGISVFRSSHLFVIYHKEYSRGYFAAFSREKKKELYIKGIKFIDYNCVRPNFRGKYTKKWTADFELYEKLKENHLKEQAIRQIEKRRTKIELWFNNLVYNLVKEMGLTQKKISELSTAHRNTIGSHFRAGKKLNTQ